MQTFFKDIVDSQINKPAVIACHGPSLRKDQSKIETFQSAGKLIRFSINNWFDFFKSVPNYWILANSEFTIAKYKNKMNDYNIPVFFADSVDLTPKHIVKTLTCPYCEYDQRHFQKERCIEILQSFREYYEKNKDFKFKKYGNNETMWQLPRCIDGAGFDVYCRCCSVSSAEKKTTIQEQLQKTSGYRQHYSTGDTVALHVIAFAVIMGCNPIYISGMDLDYQKGYANNQPAPLNDDWQRLSTNLKNDLRIINESAKKRNIKIINLKHDAWYNTFEEGDLQI